LDSSPFLLRFPEWPEHRRAPAAAPPLPVPSVAEILALLEAGRVGVEYQPIVDARSGATAGHEALARFYAEGGGRLSTGYVFERLHDDPPALLRVEWELKRLQLAHAPPGPLFVNLDPDAFHEGARDGGNLLLDLLARAHPGQLVVEMTENRSLHDARRAREMVEALRRARLPVAVDDIGAPDALVALDLFADVEVLKFDRSWVRRAAAPAERATLEALVGLARRLGARSVLEGVERPADLAWARELGIDLVQGYLFRDRFVTAPIP
jgi:EAL domain-containing protein (putative c-di-GMP-specific phosphodiesterase class I)